MRLGVIQRPVDALALVASTWRGISRRQVLASLCFGAGIWLMHLILGVFVTARPPLLAGPWFEAPVVSLFLSDQIGALTLLLALTLADRFADRDPGRRWVYFAAVVMAAAGWLVVVLIVVHGTALPLGWGPIRRVDRANATWAGYGFFEWLMLNGAATFIYLDAIRARREQQRLRAAQAHRMLTAKHLVEARLQAMQARVEPAFLFNTLAQVRRLYDTHVESAERMLDDLIRYLRAAMPHMRSTTSTVDQEMELARAYLDIVNLGMCGRLLADIHVAEEVLRYRLPPMMLLPMIDRALSRDTDTAASPIALRIECDSPVGEVLRIHIACEAVELPHQTEDASLMNIRERLAALYGDRYRLVVSGGAGLAAHMTLEIPLEPVASPVELSEGVLGLPAAQ